jgi:hypothetical protein
MNSGPTAPPNTTMADNQGKSARRSRASETLKPNIERPAWPSVSPTPAPK